MNTNIITETIQAPHVFTSEEIDRMNIDLRRNLTEVDRLKDQLKSTQKDYQLRIQNAENTVRLLRNKLDAGEESRPIQAEVIFHPDRSEKHFFRLRTTDEPTPSNEAELSLDLEMRFVRKEPMTDADWQLPMFKKEEIDSAPPKPNGEKPTPELHEDSEGELTDTQGIGNDAAGATSLGDVLDRDAAATEAPKILIEHFRDGQWQSQALYQEVFIATKNFHTAQRALILNLLWDEVNGEQKLKSVEDMKRVLAPHVIGEEGAK